MQRQKIPIITDHLLKSIKEGKFKRGRMKHFWGEKQRRNGVFLDRWKHKPILAHAHISSNQRTTSKGLVNESLQSQEPIHHFNPFQGFPLLYTLNFTYKLVMVPVQKKYYGFGPPHVHTHTHIYRAQVHTFLLYQWRLQKFLFRVFLKKHKLYNLIKREIHILTIITIKKYVNT